MAPPAAVVGSGKSLACRRHCLFFLLIVGSENQIHGSNGHPVRYVFTGRQTAVEREYGVVT